ncbi:MAG: Crp/Fnr family transcriptional regulator [Burkholderiales bacterium PBB4]|nr:MAG: Crp/Fnr family transcriptional regulator [Burkholderiales bacterium PBB4]
MLGAGEALRLGPGELLYRKGDAATGFYGVLGGAIKVSTLGEDGREGILSIVEAGNWFGESSLLDGHPRPHDATATMATEVWAIPAAEFERLMQRPAFAKGIALLLCNRVRVLYGLVEDAMLRSTRTRIAKRLLTLARGDATLAVDSRAAVSVSQEALAMMLGITRQTLSKELKMLSRNGVIALGYGRIEILRLQGLESAAAPA